MTSRERILTALKHMEPDRIPVDLGGAGATGISVFAYNELKRRLGLPISKVRVYDLEQLLACVEMDVLQLVGGDVLYLTLPKFSVHDVVSWKEWVLDDGTVIEVPDQFNPIKNEQGDYEIFMGDNIAGKMPAGGHYFDQTYFPLDGKEDIKDLKDYNPSLISNIELDILEKRVKSIMENSTSAIIFHCGSSIYNYGQSLCGHVNFMMDLLANKPFAQALIEKILEYRINNMERCLDRIGKYIDIVECSDDLGTQNSLQISPETYREMIKPAHKKLFETIKGYGKYVFLHSCGAVYDLIPDLINIGIDILNPIQLSAKGMEPKRLKKEFGKDLTFWGGGCDTQRILPRGTLCEVMEEVKRNTEVLGKGGGFVFCQVHNIQPDVPVENILAMYKALEIGR